MKTTPLQKSIKKYENTIKSLEKLLGKTASSKDSSQKFSIGKKKFYVDSDHCPCCKAYDCTRTIYEIGRSCPLKLFGSGCESSPWGKITVFLNNHDSFKITKRFINFFKDELDYLKQVQKKSEED